MIDNLFHFPLLVLLLVSVKADLVVIARTGAATSIHALNNLHCIHSSTTRTIAHALIVHHRVSYVQVKLSIYLHKNIKVMHCLHSSAHNLYHPHSHTVTVNELR